MLVTFTTKAYADITMFGDVAVSLLKMMGHSGTVPSAITAEDLPAALERLTAALNSQTNSQPIENSNDDEPEVSLHTRAIPLIELLNAAIKEKADVMWQ